MLNLALKIKEHRIKLKKTKSKLAEETNMCDAMIVLIEKGTRYPNIKDMGKIADRLKMNKSEVIAEMIAERILNKYGKKAYVKNALKLIDKELPSKKNRKTVSGSRVSSKTKTAVMKRTKAKTGGRKKKNRTAR